MATLAAMLKARGHHVQGSDHGVYPPMSDFLLREGIPAFEGYRPEHITTELDLTTANLKTILVCCECLDEQYRAERASTRARVSGILLN